MVKIIRQLSEAECEQIAYAGQQQSRFFYKADMDNEAFKKALKKIIERNGIMNKAQLQQRIKQEFGLSSNASERKQQLKQLYKSGAAEFSLNNTVLDELFPAPSYRKSGHLYVLGFRVY